MKSVLFASVCFMPQTSTHIGDIVAFYAVSNPFRMNIICLNQHVRHFVIICPVWYNSNVFWNHTWWSGLCIFLCSMFVGHFHVFIKSCSLLCMKIPFAVVTDFADNVPCCSQN